VDTNALKNYLLRTADDQLIIAHRHSEWTGFGPLLEEDIAFSSIAQDKLGHAQALYNIAHEHCALPNADTLAFRRNEKDFLCCQFVELPNGEYDFSLIRHFLFDAAEYFRFSALSESTFEPLAKLAVKIRGEIKYHLYHGRTWVVQLGANGTDESRVRMQTALNYAWPFALGMFEQMATDSLLETSEVIVSEEILKKQWLEFVKGVFDEAGLKIPENSTPVFGGRGGFHTEYLQPLLSEMTEVIDIDPSAEW